MITQIAILVVLFSFSSLCYSKKQVSYILEAYGKRKENDTLGAGNKIPVRYIFDSEGIYFYHHDRNSFKETVVNDTLYRTMRDSMYQILTHAEDIQNALFWNWTYYGYAEDLQKRLEGNPAYSKADLGQKIQYLSENDTVYKRYEFVYSEGFISQVVSERKLNDEYQYDSIVYSEFTTKEIEINIDSLFETYSYLAHLPSYKHPEWNIDSSLSNYIAIDRDSSLLNIDYQSSVPKLLVFGYEKCAPCHVLKGILTDMDSLDLPIDYVYLSKDEPTDKQRGRDKKIFEGLGSNYTFAYTDLKADWIKSTAGFPHMVLIDRSGKVLFTQTGIWPDQKKRLIELFKEEGIIK